MELVIFRRSVGVGLESVITDGQKVLGKRLLCFRCWAESLLSFQGLHWALYRFFWFGSPALSMKTSCLVIALLSSIVAGAQTTSPGPQTTTGQSVLPAPTAFSAVARDANSAIWERTVYTPGPDGTVVGWKHRYTELATSLNVKDPQTGRWQPSREQIDLLPPGGAFAAAATGSAHRASFPLDIATGVIQLTTPENKQLTSRPVALFLEDDSNSVLVAVLTNSVGELVGSNSVVYPDAFGAAASVRYRNTRAGFEQDIVIQGNLPDPAACGLVPARTRIGVLTAFFDNNNPVETPGPTDPETGLTDVTLRFGMMTMTKGRAFSIGNAEQIQPAPGATPAAWRNWITNGAKQASAKGTPTFKRWFQLPGSNSHFLMEEVSFPRVAPQLEQLPPMFRTSEHRWHQPLCRQLISGRDSSQLAVAVGGQRAGWNRDHAIEPGGLGSNARLGFGLCDRNLWRVLHLPGRRLLSGVRGRAILTTSPWKARP